MSKRVFSNNHEIDEYHSHEEQVAHGYQNGDLVQVLSRTAQGWVEGQVVGTVLEGRITVEFNVPGHGQALFRKHLLPTSPQLYPIPHDMASRSPTCSTDLEEHDPGATYVCQWEARSALNDFVISFDSDLSPEEMPRLTDSLDLEYKGNNAFKTSCLSGAFMIAYRPQRDVASIVDVVLKVHALPEKEPDEHVRYVPVGPVGFVHTLLHKDETVAFHPDIPGLYSLGLTVNKDLSSDLRKRMQANRNGDKDYFEGLFERFKKTWNNRGDERGETLAGKADFLISYTGHDKEDNEKLLMLLRTNAVAGPHNEDPSNTRPIKFCTDRSLGFGVHFHQRGGGVDDDEGFTLKLGKHGFAQPLEDGTWWDEYKGAALMTKCGILLLQLSENYFQSAACLKEFTEIPLERVWVLQSGNQDGPTLRIIHILQACEHLGTSSQAFEILRKAKREQNWKTRRAQLDIGLAAGNWQPLEALPDHETLTRFAIEQRSVFARETTERCFRESQNIIRKMRQT